MKHKTPGWRELETALEAIARHEGYRLDRNGETGDIICEFETDISLTQLAKDLEEALR